MRFRNKLICSAATKEELQQMINDYFYTSGMVITDDLHVLRKNGMEVENFKATFKRNRYRFELPIPVI